MDDNEKARFKESLAGRGPTSVRTLLARGFFQGSQIAVAEEWLAEVELDRSAASNQDSLRIASSAKNAAWIAATAAIVAAIISMLGAVITFLSWLYPRR